MKGEINVAKHLVKCSICGITFDANTEEHVKTHKGRRYAHLKCSLDKEANLTQEEKEKQEFEEYVMDLLNIDFIDPRVRRQINQFIKEYKYTYSGMKKALVYFYEVKGNDKSKANGGIGIIPFVYRDAFNYYYSLWLAQQKNEEKEITLYKPQEEEITIPRPVSKPARKRFFAFLDDKEEN